MTDLESDLRLQLNGELDPIALSPDVAGTALDRGRRDRRRRTASFAGAGVGVLLLVGLAVTQGGGSRRADAPASTVRSTDQALQVVKALSAGHYADARTAFSTDLRAQLSEAGLRTLWTGVVDADLGGFVSATLAHSGDTYSGSLHGRTADGRVLLTTDGTGHLTTVFVEPSASDADATVQVVNQFATGDFTSVQDQFVTGATLSATKLQSTWLLLLDDGGAVTTVGAPDYHGSRTVVPLTLDHGFAELIADHSGRGIAGLLLLKTDPALEAHTRAVVADFAAGRFADIRTRFNERMTSGLSEQQLKQAWNTMLTKHHGFLRLNLVLTSESRDTRLQIAQCQMGQGSLNVQISYDAAGRINGLYLRES